MQTVIFNNTCDASILNRTVATWEQSNKQKRLSVKLNVHFLRVSFNLALAGGESLAYIKFLQTQRGGSALILLEFQNVLQGWPGVCRFSDRRQYSVQSVYTFTHIYRGSPRALI
jgi:hypothetical protein